MVKVEVKAVKLEPGEVEFPEVKVETKPDVADLQHIDTSKWKAGQKFSTPSPGNGDRVFYETLLQQRPDSEMAQDWCIAYGVLPEDKAKKLYAASLNRKVSKPAISSTVASSPVKKSAATGASLGRKRKVVVEDDADADTGLGTSSAWEHQGRIGV